MATNKLVDGEFLSRLLEGSYESVLARVSEEIDAHPDLFSGHADEGYSTIGTFNGNAIVATEEGRFFRVAYTESGAKVTLGNVEQIDVPVYEASDLRVQVREHAATAVDRLLSGKGSEESILALYDLVSSGVPLTSNSVEEALDQHVTSQHEWLDSLREHEREIVKFVGAEAKAKVPVPRFESLSVATEIPDPDRVRMVVVNALRDLRTYLNQADMRLAVARQVDEGYSNPGAGHSDIGEFMALVLSLDEDVQFLRAIVEDSVVVSDDGDPQSLARIHDAVASRIGDFKLAVAFAEKFARGCVPAAT
jgi:hypothetical protein